MPCPSCFPARLLALVFAGAVLLAGCGGGSPETVEPVARYDAYGTAITADDALPIQMVAAERDRYSGQTVKVEGLVAEVCQNAGCWLTLAVDPETTPVRVEVPRDSSGAYVYTFPMDISGRRIVVAGTLLAGDGAGHEHGEHADEGGAHSEEEAAAMALDLAIVADGALVERISS